MNQPESTDKQPQTIQKSRNRVVAFFSEMNKQKYTSIGFYILIIFVILNVSLMLLHLLDPHYTYPVLKHSFISAVYEGQDVNETMYTDVIRIKKFNPDDIRFDEKVVIYGDFGTTEYWVESIESVDPDFETVELTYDQISTITVSYDDIIGVKTKEASFVCTIYYTAKTPQGFLLLFMSHAFIVAAYYFGFVDRRE